MKLALPLLLWAASAAAAAGPPQKILDLGAYRLSCSKTEAGALLQAVSRAARHFQPCGIALRLSFTAELKPEPAWCALPETEAKRKPLLQEMSWPLRLRQPQSLTLFLLPTDSVQPRWSFALVDKSPGAGCGSPLESRFLHRFGTLFMTDFSFQSGDEQLPAILLAHEIAHALSMEPHPTGAARGTVLADHLADMGPAITPGLCACMRQSPYLR